MLVRFLLMLGWVSLMSELVHSAELATSWYRVLPVQLNGQDTPGRWSLQAGDRITTGTRGQKKDSKVKLDYPDSSVVYTGSNSEVILHPGWLDVPVGGLDLNVVDGTKYVEQAETPLGIFRIHGVTGTFDIPPPTSQPATDEPRMVEVAVKSGAFEWQIDLADAPKLPRIVARIDAGDQLRFSVSPAARRLNILTEAGEGLLHLGTEVTLKIPARAQGDVTYELAQQTFRIRSLQGELTLVMAGKAIPIGPGEQRAQVVASNSGQAERIASRRGVVETATALTEPAAAYTPPAPLLRLPHEHAYQQTLRDYLATLVERDLDPGPLVSVTVAGDADRGDDERKFRNWLLSLDITPQVGRKRSAPSMAAPARLFLLSTIESPEGVCRPPAWAEPLAWLSEWNEPGNAYYGSRAVKLRAFVTATVMMLMLDHAQEHHPELGVARADNVGNHLTCYAYVYPRVSRELPEGVREAYRTGLKKIAQRVLDWGPRSEAIGSDVSSAVGVFLAGEATEDAALRSAAQAYARRLVTDPRFFHPAGYFVTLGGLDSAYAGQARYYAVWLALLSDDPVVKDALERSYRLRAHLTLPDPDGTLHGPSHFNPLTSQVLAAESYSWKYREFGAAMLTDEAVYQTRLPTETELDGAAQKRLNEINAQIRETPEQKPPEELIALPWKFIPQSTSWSFPNVINIAEDSYRPGSFARLVKLHAEGSPMLQLPFARETPFLRSFDQAFTIGKQPSYGLVVHTGPIGHQLPDVQRYPGPFGFGGGQLSAFWTPRTGSVILGRRGGMNATTSFDQPEQWRLWPIHAVSGLRHDGLLFTSAQIRTPDVDESIQGLQGKVSVRGTIPPGMFNQAGVLTGRFDYERSFDVAADRLTVSTRVRSDGRDKLTELVESIPIFLREMNLQRKAEPTQIEWLVEGRWRQAEPTYRAGVTAVRLTRFDGRVRIEFDRPRRVKLSPEDWNDTYYTRAACRNVLIDLLESNDQPRVVQETETRYTLIPDDESVPAAETPPRN